MKKSFLRLFTGLTLLFVILMLADVSSAQRRRARGRVYTQQQVEQLLERIEERTDAFTKSFDEALDDSRLDTTRTEENYTDRARDLENATDELRREFDHDDSWAENHPEARKVLSMATVMDRIMRSRNFGAQTETTWVRLRTELNTLARIYRLPAVGSRSYPVVAVRNVSTVRQTARGRVSSKQQIEQLLERIEERADAFTKWFDEALDDNRRLNGTRVEKDFTDSARALENVADELRREFDHDDTRGETSANARKVLAAASNMDRIMRSRNFGAQTETMWVNLRADLNALARIYRLPAVGARSYR